MVSSVTSRRLATKSTPVKTPVSPTVHTRTSHLAMRLSDHPDPHAHPCSSPPPASPLAIYMLAHRYRLEVLEDLAKERILKGLTVDNCMPIL
jgi:hypothetical protein